MAGKEDRFAYKTMASIVHKQDRKDVIRDEPTGESERVSSSQLKHEMGAALRPSSSSSANRKAKPALDQIKKSTSNYEDLLRMGASYEPTTKLTERVWENFLALLSKLLPGVERDVLRSAAEESLNVLKAVDQFTTQQRRQQLERLLECSVGSDEDFRLLLGCADQLTDFVVQGQDEDVGNKKDKQDMEIPIVFEDDDEGENGENGGAGGKGLGAVEMADGELVEHEVVSLDSDEDHQERTNTTITTLSKDEDDSSNGVVDPIAIDGFWLQRELSQQLDNGQVDATEVQSLAEEILLLFGMEDVGQVENHLVSLVGFDRLDLVKRLLNNRLAIYWCTKLHRAKSNPEREEIKQGMRATNEGKRILNQLSGNVHGADDSLPTAAMTEATEEETFLAKLRVMPSGRLVDLAALARLTSTTSAQRSTGSEVLLPKGSWRKTHKSSEEVHVPAAKPKEAKPEDAPLVKIVDLPKWMQPAFAGMSELNRVQTKVYPAVLAEERFNMLVSAPTSAGKTNIAMLSIMREVSRFVNPTTGILDIVQMKERMKIVYVAPMKALVQEVVQNFSARLTNTEFGIQVKELSGDSQLTRQQIKDTQLLVTTPEKWDVVSRKAGERSFVSLVKLVIVDEIHLLNDTRGAVLEALIARILYLNQQQQETGCRLLGISATLPNYLDVARFLRVPLDRGLFYFDSSYRPVPLQQVFIGVTDQKALTRAKHMDQICFDKVCESAKREHQVLVFVHSRKATFRLAKLFQQRAQDTDQIDLFLPNSMASREVLLREEVKSSELKQLLQYGLAVHHAGMLKQDRTLVEDLFAAGHIRVLVCTATLAWGVNLPAHTVIIAGTQVYNPERAGWTELPQLDLLQMLGRAGRPQFDTEGEGLVITTYSEMLYYLSLCNNQLQVESSLLHKLSEHINAEVVIGNISSLAEAVEWLKLTYLHIRAGSMPSKYGVNEEIGLDQWEVDVCHAALLELEGMNLIHYDHRTTFQVQGTALGRITSHYYLSPETMSNFVKVLDGNASSLMDLLRILTVADEFKQISVRHEEKLELAKLADRVPIPIKESLDEPSAKVNVLLQAYISNWLLEGYCLRCDLIYVHQSASRLARALFEICLHKRYAQAAINALGLCRSLDRKLWRSQSPLRQLKAASVEEDVVRQLERKSLQFSVLHALSPAQLAALIKNGSRQVGQQLHQIIHRFPKLDAAARVQTLSRTSLRVELAINCDFEFDADTLGQSLLFWILVLDADGNELFHREPFALKSRFAGEEHLATFVLCDLPEPLPMFLLIKIESDTYLHCTTNLAVPLHSLLPPKKALPFSELLDLQLIQTANLPNADFFQAQHVIALWPSQTQTYSLMQQQQDNMLVAMPIGKTLLAEVAMLRALELDAGARILYLSPEPLAVQIKFTKWTKLFTNGTRVGQLFGFDSALDLKTLQECNVIVSSAKTYEALSRRWKQKSRKVVYELSLVVVDDLQLGNVELEVCVSRLRYIAVNLDRHIRLVGMCSAVLNAEDLASWMGNAKLVSLPPSARPGATEVSIVGFTENHFETRQGLMIRPAYRAVREAFFSTHGTSRAFVFLPSKRHVKLALIDFIQFLCAEEQQPQVTTTAGVVVGDAMLRSALMHGMAVIHQHLSGSDLLAAQTTSMAKVVLIAVDAVWKLNDDFVCTNVVVMGTTWFHQQRFQEYPAHFVQKLVNKSAPQQQGERCKQTVLCFEPHKDVLKRTLGNGAFLESQLEHSFGDVLLGEICTTKTVTTKQDAVDFFTWTLFYRRLLKNPNYYFHSSTGNPSTFLSEIVDNAVQEIRDSLCLEEEEEEDVLKATSLGMIASFHDVKSNTMELFATSLDSFKEFKLTKLFDVVASASEFIPLVELHPREEFILEALARNSQCVSLPIPNPGQFTELHIKINLLLQTWCNHQHRTLPIEQREEIKFILLVVPKLLHALVDLSSSQGWLKACVTCLELCQTIVQQVWQTEPIQRQIPHYQLLRGLPTTATVYDLIDMEDTQREALFTDLSGQQIEDVAKFCNAYPSANVSFQIVVDGLESNQAMVSQSVQVVVSLDQDQDEEEGDGLVVSTNFPHPKANLWWAILGQEDQVVAIKRINSKQATLVCEFTTPGPKQLKLLVMCDSYLGCDQQFDLQVLVV
ncbi:hypothetical protein BASA81_000974 [Batrachochytrium salamandrivorans]|nr:hypothetical protein BASA81_000974 [Batrachochytrium salamandrivorans]